MTTLCITGLSSNNLSIEGQDLGERINRLFISNAVGSSPATISNTELIGDVVLCTALSNYITAGTVRVNIGTASGTLVTAAKMLTYSSASAWDSNDSSVLTRDDITDQRRNDRLLVEGLAIDTLNDEVSATLGGLSTEQFTPTHVIMHLSTVVGTAATGDVKISVGTTTGGTEILAATECTDCKVIDNRFIIAISGLLPSVANNSTIFVKCTVKDTSAGAGHLADVYVVGEAF